MPLPPFENTGWLPQGVYEATIEEVKESFGKTQGGECRPDLMKNLLKYVEEAEKCNFIKCIIINGSFISQKFRPNDVDIMVVLDRKFDQTREDISLWEKNLTDERRIKKRYPSFDVYTAIEGSTRYHKIIGFWGINRNNEPKGMILVAL